MPGPAKLWRILCIVFLLPLLYINVRNYHDWGDDFAQYLLQARNIVTGQPQTDNGLVFDKVDGDFALHAYPAGFPLIISPLYYFFQLSVEPYYILISIFMIGLGLLMFNYFKKHFSPVISLMIVMFILYNRYLLWLKDSILSDIPFVFFLFLLIQIFERKKNSTLFYITCGILAAWVSSIRFVGIATISALIADILLHDPKANSLDFSFYDRKRIKSAGIVILSAASFFFLFNTFIFHIGINDFFGFYSNSFNKESSGGLLINSKYYYDVLGTVFLFPGSENSFLPAWWVFIGLAGWLLNLRKKAGFTEWFFIFYLLIILLFNRSTGGFRFIFPVFPLLIKYTIDIILLLFNPTGKLFREGLVATIILFLMAGYIKPLKTIIREQKIIHDGPYVPTSSEMLEVVNSKIPQNEVIGFYKALVISLYTNHHATYLMTGQSPEQVEAMFLRLKVNYLIATKQKTYDTDIYDPRLDAYFEKFNDRYNRYWENADYIIFKRLTTN